MDYFSQIIKGVLIGTANILPGISGGTLAISMGVYEQILYALTHLHKEPKKSLSTLLPYIAGALGGIVGLSFTMEYLFATWPLQTNLTFIGLIFGGLPAVFSRIFHPQLSLIKAEQGPEVTLGGNLISSTLLFLIGIMSAGTMVIPGISGSMILMMIGYYQPLLSAINQALFALLTGDFSTFFIQGILLFPFALGLCIGFYLFARLMETLFSRFARITYCAILGLIISSPIGILAGLPGSCFSLRSISTGGVCFMVALLFVLWIGQD